MAFNQFPYTNFHELNLDWVLHQIKKLAAKVDAMASEKDSAHTTPRNVVIIGDSYGTSNGGGVVISRPYPTIIQESGRFSNVYTACKNGAGFANGGFMEMLNSLAIDDPESVTDLIVLGGWNDRNWTYNHLSNAMVEFRNSVNSKYTNAKLELGFISFGYEKLASDTEYATLMACRTSYFALGQTLGYTVFKNLQWIMRNRDFMIADGAHPNQNGMLAIANGVISCLETGDNSVQYWKRWTNSDFSIDSAFNASSAPSSRPIIEEELNNGVTQIHLFNKPGFGWQLTFNTPLVIDHKGQKIQLGKYPQYLIRGFGEISRVPTLLTLINGATSINIPASICLNNGNMYLETYWTSFGSVTSFTAASIVIANADAIVYDYQER